MVTRPASISRYVSALGIMVGLWLGGCNQSDSGSNPSSDARPQVVSTSTIIANWADEVGGDDIQLTGILKPGADPHIYEPVPMDSIAFENADLILYNGYNLEPGLIRMMNAAGVNAQKVAVGEVVRSLQMEKEGQRVPDPHVWGDVRNAIAMTNAIRDALTKLSPDDEADFQQNSDRLIAELEQLHGWIKQQIDTIPPAQRKLVTTHDAFEYYAQAYGLEVVGTLIGISTEEQPSAQTVQKLVDSIKAVSAPAIFAETTINPRLITTVAEESGVKLSPTSLYSDSIGAPGGDGDSYVKMMVSNTRAIVEALGGTYTPFEAGPVEARE